jgi:hypothetical protein
LYFHVALRRINQGNLQEVGSKLANKTELFYFIVILHCSSTLKVDSPVYFVLHMKFGLSTITFLSRTTKYRPMILNIELTNIYITYCKVFRMVCM